MDINNLWSEYDLNSKRQNTRCLAVNTILEGKYLVGPVLGQGGFGITYAGYDLNMEAKIAIKEYFPVELVSRDTTTMHGDRVLSLSGEKSVTYKAGLKKYVAEAQNVSQFSEIPGVVSVKDFFYANETAYIVMEFIDGISLKDYLKEKGGRLTEEEALKIMKPVLEALVQVHKAGIIHRDISPDNIMLTFQDGNAHNQIESVKLIDFGAARMTEKNDQKSLTIILKHGYAPEEQYRTHGEQGPWTDVYALCAVLYRMLTGETPIPAMDRMFKDELKTLEQCGVKANANTADAILKGLAVKKEERIQSVDELILALEQGISRKKQVRQKKMVIAAGIVTAVLFATVGILGLAGNRNKTDNALLHASNVTMESSKEVEKDDAVGQSAESMVDFIEDEDVGEQIAFYRPNRSISVSDTHILFCLPDGTVQARGRNAGGQCHVEEWNHVVSVIADYDLSLGLRSDGTVLYAGDVPSYQDVELWTDIVDIQTLTGRGGVVGLKKDGTVVSLGIAEQNPEMYEALSQWNDMKAIHAGYFGIYGLHMDGSLSYAGTRSDYAENPYLNINRIEDDGWKDVEWMIGDEVLYGITKDGTVLSECFYAADEEQYKELEIEADKVKAQKMYQCNDLFYFGVGMDGSVFTGQHFVQNQRVEKVRNEISLWKNLQAVSVYDPGGDGNIYYGLTKDGKILECIDNWGNAELNEFQNLKWVQILEHVNNDNIVACTKSGDILTYGLANRLNPTWLETENGKQIKTITPNGYLLENGTAVLYDENNEEVKIKNVVQMEEFGWGAYLGESYCEYILHKKDGSMEAFLGGSKADQEWRWDSYREVNNWSDIKQFTDYSEYIIYGLREDGTILYSAEDGTCEIEVDKSVKIKEICSGLENNLLGVTKDGTIHVLKKDEVSEQKGMLQVEGWNNIQHVAMGESHTVGLREDGTVVAVGQNYAGQCDVENWKDVESIAVGRTCTLGVTKNGKLLIAGSLY